MLYATMNSPVGELLLVGDETALRGLHFPNHRHPLKHDYRSAREPFAAAREQLEQYFAGERREFDLPLHATGDPVQQRVWRLIAAIPYGRTATYGELARALGDGTTAQEVGAAVGSNPLSILVGCHRVLGSGGKLTGYAGGLGRKRRLLEL